MFRVFARQWAQMRHGTGHMFVPALVLLFAGLLAMVILTGLTQGVDRALARDLKAGMLWLLFITALGLNIDDLFTDDARDGTLAQAYLAAQQSLWPYALGMAMVQGLGVMVPSLAVLLALWNLGGAGAMPWGPLMGLFLPLLTLRLLAGALNLSASRVPGVGTMVYLVLAAPMLLLAVGDMGTLIAAVGLIFAPLFFALVPPSLPQGLRP